jgi:hypothetical protein
MIPLIDDGKSSGEQSRLPVAVVASNSDDMEPTTIAFGASSSTTSIFVTSPAWQQKTLGHFNLVVTADRVT